MEITVHLYGNFRKLADSPSFPLEVEEGSSLKELMDRLHLPDPVYRMALINNIRVQEDTILKNGDDVHIFQPVGGG